MLNLVNLYKVYSDFRLIRTKYAAQLGSKAEKRRQPMIDDSTYNSPNEIKINSAKFYKFLFLIIFLITAAFAKSFL